MNLKAFDLMINSALKGSSVKALESTLHTFCKKLDESDVAIKKEAYPLIDETLFDILPALKDGDSYQLPRFAWTTLGGDGLPDHIFSDRVQIR